MASSQTLKQKFIDLLFEDEYDVSNPEVKNRRPESRMKASDILYKKPEAKKEEPVVKAEEVKREEPVKRVVQEPKVNNTFINYEQKEERNDFIDVIKTPVYDDAKREEPEEKYVAQPFLSPMFGSLEKEEKKAKEPISDVNYACLEKPRSSYLGTVLSPIYGYESITNVQKETKKVDNSKKVATDVTSDLADIFSSVDFNEKEDMDKTAEINLFDELYKTKD